MRRRTASSLAVVSLALASRAAHAQSPPAAPTTIAVGDWQLAPRLELRTRGEYRRDPVDMGGTDLAGNVSGRVRNAYGVLERTRVGLGAEHGAIAAQVTLQDARAWGVPVPSGVLGADPGSGSAPSSTAAYEAWFEVHTSAARPTWLRIGRQAITWGDGRLVSNADWSPVARTLDAARGHWSAGLLDVEAFAAILDTPSPLGPAVGQTLGPTSTGTQLYGAQIGATFDPLLRIELSLLARVARSNAAGGSRFDLARARGETYAGDLRVAGESRGWRYAAEGAYELGRVELLGDASTSAWAAAGYVEKRIDALLLAPTLRLGVDYASGDDGSGGTYKQFDPLLPDVHALHGAMDALSWSNTIQASARVTLEAWTEGRVAVEYRYARLAEGSGEWLDGYLATVGRSRGDTEIGHEVDAWAAWRPWPALDLVGGYSVLALGDAGRAVMAFAERGALQADGSFATAALAHTAYLQATLRVP